MRERESSEPVAAGDSQESGTQVDDASLPLTERISTATALLYGLPAIGLSLPNILFALYFFKFATDVLLIAPGVLGLLIGLSRAWDAVSDPVAGYYSDRTETKMGRRRPWMLVGGFGLALAVIVLWAPPQDLEGTPLVMWIGGSLLLLTTASTVFGVPYGALGTELTSDHHDRTRIFAYRIIIGGVGSTLALGAFYLLMEAEKPAESWLGLGSREVALGVAVVGAVVGLASIVTLVSFIRERPEYQGRGPNRIFGAYRDVFSNRHAQLLLFVYLVQTFGTASMGMLAAYLFQYILKAPNWMMSVMVGAFVFPMAMSIPFWVRISRRFGKARCVTATLWILGVLYCALYFGMTEWQFENPAVIGLACSCAGVLGVVSACGYVVSPSIKADIIDVDEYHTNERKEGAYLAAWSFTQKTAAALAAMLLGAALEVVGYTPGVEQTGPARFVIAALISFVPGIGFMAAALLFGRFDLDEKEHLRIRTELDNRAMRAI